MSLVTTAIVTLTTSTSTTLIIAFWPAEPRTNEYPYNVCRLLGNETCGKVLYLLVQKAYEANRVFITS